MKCDLCKKQIEVKKEKYVHVEDWENEKLIKDFWVHFKCFNKAMNRDLTNLEKQSKHILDTALPILNNFLPQQKEVYEIK